MFFLIALILGALGAGIVFFSRNVQAKLPTFLILTTIYTLIGWLIIWASLPSNAYPVFGAYAWLLFLWWIITGITEVNSGYNEEFSHSWWFPIILFIVLMISLISGAKIFRSDDYAKLIGPISDKEQKHWSQDVQPLDPTHIRLVPQELAISLAKTALSDGGMAIGSQFPLNEGAATLQKVGGEYWYLIPLDFSGFSVWTRAKHTGVPGYVKVSAIDPYLKPILVLNQKMFYTPGAFWSKDLERHLYPEYKNRVLRDFSFEADDNGKVYWVISVCTPTIAWGGLKVEGVVLCDPETGTTEYASNEQVTNDKKYEWIDRITPGEFVSEYVNNWGKYRDGWWNAFWTHINLLEGESPILNYSADGKCMFVTPITSTNMDDQTMTGLMYTDARTGKSTYYRLSGGATEAAVVDAVNNAVGFKNWHGSEQIVYENVFGKLSALVPILGQNGTYQGLAIVENENKRCAIGTSPQDALIAFQNMIMNSGGQISTENARNLINYEGKITRLGWEISGTSKQYYLYFDGFKNSFTVSNALQSELALTKEGDLVKLQYIAAEQAAVPVLSFQNLTLGLKGSKNENTVRDRMTETRESNQLKADVKDFREELKDMSDDDVKKLMEKK